MTKVVLLFILSFLAVCFPDTSNDTNFIVEKDSIVQEKDAKITNVNKVDNELKGLSEIAVSGSLSFVSEAGSSESNSPTVSTFMLDLQYGRFVLDPLEIGGRLSLGKTNYSDLAGQYGAFISFHFTDFSKSKVPFITANYQLFFGSPLDQNTYLFGAGIKNIIGNACVIVEAFYMNYTISDSRESLELSITGLQLGMSYLF